MQSRLQSNVQSRSQDPWLKFDSLDTLCVQSLNRGHDPRAVLEGMLVGIARQLAVEEVYLACLEPCAVEIDCPRSVVLAPDDRQWLTAIAESSLRSGRAATFCDTHLLGDCTSRPSLFAIAPIYLQDRWWGCAIFKSSCLSYQFYPDQLDALAVIADYLALALREIHLQAEIARLDRDNQQLQNNSQNKSDFLSHMSHELRTPLTGIMGFSKMLREEIYGTLNDKQKQYVSGIAASGEHLLALVNDFLDLAKIEANREELYLETVAVEDICRAAIAIVEGRAREKDLDLLLEIGRDVDFCTVDRRRIKQILLNLLSNAIKFTETGSIALSVQLQGAHLAFCTIDTGIGIAEADCYKLFEPFQQINNALSRKHKGTGLGLALSRKLARLHGGDLTLSSTVGQGSCFTLYLPLAPTSHHNQGESLAE